MCYYIGMDRRNEKIGEIGKIILVAVAIAGIITLAAAFPNAPQMLKLFGFGRRRKSPYYINTVVRRLESRGLISFQKNNGKIFIRLTQRGRDALVRHELRDVAIRKKKRWDNKWRVVIFDIKEIKRSSRDALRRELISFGFVKLQNSVWVSPHECEDVVAMLKGQLHVGKDILYMTVEKIENDRWLRQTFNLSSS